MTLRISIALWAVLGVLLLLPLPSLGAETGERPIGVVDLHVDLSYQTNYRGQDFSRGTGQYPAAALRRAGVLGVVLPLYVPHDVSPTGPRAEDLERSYGRVFSELVSVPPYRVPGCVGPPDRVQTWLAFEGSAPLGERPDDAARWVARGVRLFGLVHAYDNRLATSSGMRRTPRRIEQGLTAEGRALIERVHALGAMIDVSHASDRTVREVVEMARAAGAPVVASHSNARAVYSHARNLTDEQALGIASTGGVLGVNFHSGYLTAASRASIDDVVHHVRHFVRLVGATHVAIGSDYEGGIRPPPGLEDVSGYQRLASALLQAGMTREQVERIFAKNALRLLCGR
jgi:membrane dipeptidase